MKELPFKFRDQCWLLGHHTRIMGILNVTPDSFSDGGRFAEVERAVAQGIALSNEGADIIDIGGESTRPGAETIDPATECERVVPVIEALRQQVTVPISIDTRKTTVAERAINAGADIVNDVSGFRYDPTMMDLVRTSGAGCIIMHMLGRPADMQKNIVYDNLIDDITRYFQDTLDDCAANGIRNDQIMLDPGIGFGKTLQHNLELINAVEQFRKIGRPLLMGPSRKSFIGTLTDVDDPASRIWGTAAAVTACILNGADVIRVHDVAAMRQVGAVASALRTAAAKKTSTH